MNLDNVLDIALLENEAMCPCIVIHRTEETHAHVKIQWECVHACININVFMSICDVKL